MALRELVEGDCGGSNSLVRLTSHFVQDHGLKDEGFLQDYPPNDSITNSSTEQLVQQFMEENIGQSAQPFRMDTLLAEMRELEGRRSHVGVVRSPSISQLAAQEDAQTWAQQYIDAGKVFQESSDTGIWAMDPSVGDEEVYELGFGPKWAEEYLQSTSNSAVLEPQLADLSTSEAYVSEETKGGEETSLKETANQILKSADDPKFTYSKFMKFMKKIGEGEVTIDPAGRVIGNDDISEGDEDDAEKWSEEFLRQYDRKGPSLESVTGADIGEKSFNNNLWKSLTQQWNQMTGSTDSGTGSWVSEFTDFTNSPKDYTFTKDNPLVDLPDPLDEGRKRLSAGDLPSAVLCFEAAVTKEPDNPLAWQLLGSTQAENEQDPQAISALRKCLQIEPNNLTALMSLAVCFTNENYQSQACKVLKEWLRANPKYTDLVPSSENDFESAFLGLSLMTGELHDQVKGMYLEAARRNPTETIDADVQCGLGVLFNLSSETDRAVDCFKVALQARPDDAALWNRLGATLANGSRSEEAIDAYRNALQLSPGFIRARYNLGISCVHLGAHREAAEHLLTALNQQAAGRGVQGEKYTAMSDTIWTTLRLVTSILERPDLVSVINSRDLVRLNKEFGIE